MNRKIFISFVALMAMTIWNCQQATENEEAQFDAVLEEQAAFGYEVNEVTVTGDEIYSLTQDSEYLEEQGIPGFSSAGMLKRKAESLAGEITQYMPQNQFLSKISADSLIFYEETYRNGYGKRKALYYDTETGKARFYEVVFQFPEGRNMRYDSSEVIVDLNGTLGYAGDDLLVSMYRQQLFKDDFFVQSIVSSVTVTDYDGSRVTGFTATTDSYYHANRELSHKNGSVEINPDHSGTLSETFEFRDATTSFHSVTFNGDHTGTFSGQRRDGTTITGLFNRVWDDLHGSWSETVDFPEGRYLDKVMRSAEVSITLQDSTFNGTFAEIVFFSSGEIDSAEASIEITSSNGVKTTTINRTRKNGAHGTFVIVENEEGAVLEGVWTTWDGHYILVNAEYYVDGSAHLHYEVYTSEASYNNGDDPIIIADYYFSPDGGGKGTITYNGETYQVSLDGSGQGRLSLGGRSKAFNLFRGN